ncbi:MAG TPA: peptidoglycan-binding protein [Streptomyces sp.]|nr:peptidoglycan-binding protein [Streptomyces sp.]
MEAPVFEEFDPVSDCECPGCVHRRRVPPYVTGRPLGRTAAVAAVSAASATVLSAHPAAALADVLPAVGPLPRPAADPAPPGSGTAASPGAGELRTPQGARSSLHGAGGRTVVAAVAGAPRETTRSEIVRRARTWVAEQVPYDMGAYWSDGYRQDCSGYVSMAWNLPGNEWTGSLAEYAERISREELAPGDILLFHNPSDPQNGSHVVIFGGWTDGGQTSYLAYEQTRPHTRRQTTPYAYWSNSDRYVPYRYRGVTDGPAEGVPESGDETGAEAGDQQDGASGAAVPFPGRAYFGPGANNPYVTRLGELLVARGAGRFYRSGPGPRWTDADQRATRAFQLAQGWRGAEADGLPGPHTWRLLTEGGGKDIEAADETATTRATGEADPAQGGDPQESSSPDPAPPYPGRDAFRPGAENAYVTLLGRQLLRKGFGAHYAGGPGTRWTEADRRGVEAFQRAQGWRGSAADGSPGPETWRRLFT